MAIGELMTLSAREHPQNQHLPLNPFMFCLVQVFFPLIQSRNSFKTVVLRHFPYCYWCHFLPYYHCLMLRLLCFSLNALQVLWKWNTFTEKVMLAHNGSIRKACGGGKWTNLDHFCHSEQSSDNQRLMFLWSISTLEIFWLKMHWFSHFFFTHMSIKMCLFVCVPIGIFQSPAMPEIAHRHTHIWETHQSLLQRGSSREYVCIWMDGWMLYVHCYQQHIE